MKKEKEGKINKIGENIEKAFFSKLIATREYESGDKSQFAVSKKPGFSFILKDENKDDTKT